MPVQETPVATPAPIVVAPAVAPAPASAPTTAAAEVETSAEANVKPAKQTVLGAEVFLALPKDGATQYVRSSPGLRVYGYKQLRERLAITASGDYVRGLNQSEVPAMVTTDVYSFGAGVRVIVSQSATHSLYAEGMAAIEHMAVDVGTGDGISGTGFGLRFAIGAEVILDARWRATATLGYTSAGVDVKGMDGTQTTLGIDFLMLGMGAGTSF